jgi:cobyrinic acid a,c-diamide synthase
MTRGSRAGRLPAIVIAGVSSGVGKTTVSLAILEALRRRGLVAQAFKVGPDFIDPAFHELATGRPAYSLDGWMCAREDVLRTVARQAADADLAVVEGVMGCFDGLDGTRAAGSTAEIAKWLGAPVVLVVDAGAMVRSAAAVVLGFEAFDPDLELGGVILNRAGGGVHRRWLADAIAQSCRSPVLGALPHDPAVRLPERHLGLVTAAEGAYSEPLRRRLADLADLHVDVEALVRAARSRIEREPGPRREAPRVPAARIGVARDEAFQFYYQENLDQLQAAGAALIEWSPLHDAELPEVDGLYLGGGYPELHGSSLSANRSQLRQVRAFAESGRPVYAECGGLMYLAESLVDADGARWPMAGLLPATVRMEPGRLAIGYREVETTAPSLLGPAGTRARGHEFHCSTLGPVPGSMRRSYSVSDGRGAAPWPEGFAAGRALMSYVHLHFGSCPELARSFVSACARGC